MGNALEIRDLKKTYASGTEALKGVSLSVKEGDFFALLGPNGAGKSTLINIICGLTSKTSGDVVIQGLSIDDDIQRAKMHVGIVPQEFNFNIFEKPIDIVINQAGLYGIARSEARPRAEELLKQLGIYEKRNDQARMLSGGMKRRLMIARGLVHNPTLLILDEPTAGVDIELRRGMWSFLTELNKKDVTIIMTTHYLEEAETLCKNVAIINKGDIVVEGEIKSLLANMEKEVFVFDLSRSLTEEKLDILHIFAPHVVDTQVELTLTKEHNLTRAFTALSGLGIDVLSMRNKTNRLEEFFVQKTGSSFL